MGGQVGALVEMMGSYWEVGFGLQAGGWGF